MRHSAAEGGQAPTSAHPPGGCQQQGDQEEIYGTNEVMDDELEKGSAITVNSNSSGNSNSNDYSTNAQVGHDTDIERTGSHHSYEEIPPSEANSEVSVKILYKTKTG